MNKYLVKIQFDCNDADYVYGLKVINQEEKDLIDKNLNEEVRFGAYDFSGGNTRLLKDCMRVYSISGDEYDVLKRLDLLEFGEGHRFYPEELGYNEEE